MKFQEDNEVDVWLSASRESCFECSCGEYNFYDRVPEPLIDSLRMCRECGKFWLIEQRDDERGLYAIRDKTLEFYQNIQRTFLDVGSRQSNRGVFYQLINYGYPKTDNQVQKVHNALKKMRWCGWLDWDLISDDTRAYRKPTTYTNAKEALDEVSRFYRKSLWSDNPAQVQIWVEKRALAGIMYEITSRYDVRLYPANGFASLTYIKDAAEEMKRQNNRHYFIYHFGDLDASGLSAAESISDTLKRFNCYNFEFKRIAVTPEQVEALNLPTRKPKKSDKRSKNYPLDYSCELDAINSTMLKQMVEGCIKRHINDYYLECLEAQEEREREILKSLRIE